MHSSDISRAELAAWAALGSLRLAINPLEVVTALGGVQPLFQLSMPELQARLPWKKARLERVSETRPEQMLPVIERLEQRGISLIPITSPSYPPRLKQISCPPAALWLRGRVEALQGPHVAIVGSRQATDYGRRMAARLAKALAQEGIGIVSGGALGIDAAAHEGALEAGGTTVAVFGTGIERDYPLAHRELFRRVNHRGACISEFAPDATARPENFPIRNRLISGLSLGVVVVEAGDKSGALITARFALEQDREVFAIPGPVDSELSTGTNRLIQQGARLVMSAGDVIEELKALLPAGMAAAQTGTSGVDRAEGRAQARLADHVVAAARRPPLEPEASSVYECLGGTPVGIDALVERCRISPARVLEILLSLELSGLATQLPGHRFVRGA